MTLTLKVTNYSEQQTTVRSTDADGKTVQTPKTIFNATLSGEGGSLNIRSADASNNAGAAYHVGSTHVVTIAD